LRIKEQEIRLILHEHDDDDDDGDDDDDENNEDGLRNWKERRIKMYQLRRQE
jgi:hypothetical protein